MIACHPWTTGSDRPQGQVAAGGLVGGNFGPANLQAYLARAVIERDDGDLETRSWLCAIVPLFPDRGEVEWNRTRVPRRQAA